MISCKKFPSRPAIGYLADWRIISGSESLGATVLLFKILLFCYLLFSVVPVHAGVTEPDPRGEDEFDFMNVLAKKGLHDLKDERWNAYGQFTYISSWKSGFPASYTNLNGSINSL